MNDAVTIRTYEDADEDGVFALWQSIFDDTAPHRDGRRDARRKAAHDRDLFFLACLDGRIVGTVLAGYDGHRGWVYRVAVAGDVRRRGVGAALMRHAEAALARRGCPKLNLQINADNPQAVSFYERLGYRVEERVSMGRLLPPESPAR